MASLGPLESYVFPGVYTQTRTETPSPSGAGDLRYPAIIGVGSETSEETYEVVRGSAMDGANIIVGENLVTNGKATSGDSSHNAADGVCTTFFTAYKPIVKNDGQGTMATSPDDLIVTVDSVQVPVQSVNALTGTIVLVDPPAEGQLVEAAYYYKRRDSFIQDEDLSAQVDGTTTSFIVKSSCIVRGDNGGRNAVTSDKDATAVTYSGKTALTVPVLSVMVNGLPAAVSGIFGGARYFTLASAPATGATVKVSYFTNDHQNTFDIIPAYEVSGILGAGNSPPNDRTSPDWFNGVNYVLANRNEIHWGNSVVVSPDVHTVGSSEFGRTQVSARLVDNRVYGVSLGVQKVDGNKKFALPYQPVRGDGTGKSMYDPANSSSEKHDDLQVRVGTEAVTVASIGDLSVTLGTAPAKGAQVTADFYKNALSSGKWTITCDTAGGVDTGKYSVTIPGVATAYQVRLTGGTLAASEVRYLDQAEKSYDGSVNADPNVFVAPSYGIVRKDETVTVTVGADGIFTVLSDVSDGTGTAGGNTGVVGTTYVDKVTGFTISLASVSAEGTITYGVSNVFTVRAAPELCIPGVQLTVKDTTGVEKGDTATVTTMALATGGADEPPVGSHYYVRFSRVKTDYSVKYVTSLAQAGKLFGSVSQDNPIMLAAYIAFLNGAPALAVKQIKKNSGGADANVSDYITAIDEFEEPLPNGTRPCLIQPLSTDPTIRAYLKSSNSIQASVRYRNERTSYFGFRAGTTVDAAINICKALNNERLTGVYPETGVITLPGKGESKDVTVTIGGEYLAVALAAADTNPSVDVATPMIGTELAGFTRLGRVVKESDGKLVAASGCTLLQSKGGVVTVKTSYTTDMTGPLTRSPRIVEIKDEIQRGAREATKDFVGKKGLPTIPGKVASAVAKYLLKKKSAKIIYDFTGVKASYDESDPSVINVEAYYRPIFGVEWIVITFNVTTSLG